MAKERDKVELRTVDEEIARDSRFVRLHKDAVEELEELPPLRVGEKTAPEARLVAATREELKTRSNEPDVGSLIEREVPQAEDLWEESPQTGRRMPWGWVALIGCAFAAGILWSLTEVNRSDARRETLAEEAHRILKKEEQEELDAEEQIGAIRGAVRDFFDSRSVDELLRYVRQPERVKPLMERYYEDKALEPVRVKSVLGLDPLTVENSGSFWLASCELEGSVKARVLVEAKSGKDAKVDWETYVCYQPMEWDEFVTSRPGGYAGDFRVYAEQDYFYSYEFSDSDKYACFRLTALNATESLFGYVNRNGTLAKRLSEIIESNKGAPAPLILRLHVPKGGESKRGVVVEKLVSPRWLFVENPEEGER